MRAVFTMFRRLSHGIWVAVCIEIWRVESWPEDDRLEWNETGLISRHMEWIGHTELLEGLVDDYDLACNIHKWIDNRAMNIHNHGTDKRWHTVLNERQKTFAGEVHNSIESYAQHHVINVHWSVEQYYYHSRTLTAWPLAQAPLWHRISIPKCRPQTPFNAVPYRSNSWLIQHSLWPFPLQVPHPQTRVPRRP